MSPAVYASDPDAAPDTEFLPGEFKHLVVGNRGRLLDARRTPITIAAITREKGAFVVEIGAFEDAGARWELPLEDVRRFQFAQGGDEAPAGVVAELARAAARFDHDLVIDCDPDARKETLRRIATARRAAGEWLAGRDLHRLDLARHIAGRDGDPQLFALRDECMATLGVAELDHHFGATFVSNPGSGELVKGHAIVLAELGICPYRGKVVRDPNLFTGAWAKPRRAEHLVARLAFMQQLWSSWGYETVTLYRGAAVDGLLTRRSPSSFVSATLSGEVAAAHFEGGPTTQTAVLWRQEVPMTRLFMTFLETREMNSHFNEAEAVLIADPTNHAF